MRLTVRQRRSSTLCNIVPWCVPELNGKSEQTRALFPQLVKQPEVPILLSDAKPSGLRKQLLGQ